MYKLYKATLQIPVYIFVVLIIGIILDLVKINISFFDELIVSLFVSLLFTSMMSAIVIIVVRCPTCGERLFLKRISSFPGPMVGFRSGCIHCGWKII